MTYKELLRAIVELTLFEDPGERSEEELDRYVRDNSDRVPWAFVYASWYSEDSLLNLKDVIHSYINVFRCNRDDDIFFDNVNSVLKSIYITLSRYFPEGTSKEDIRFFINYNFSDSVYYDEIFEESLVYYDYVVKFIDENLDDPGEDFAIYVNLLSHNTALSKESWIKIYKKIKSWYSDINNDIIVAPSEYFNSLEELEFMKDQKVNYISSVNRLYLKKEDYERFIRDLLPLNSLESKVVSLSNLSLGFVLDLLEEGTIDLYAVMGTYPVKDLYLHNPIRTKRIFKEKITTDSLKQLDPWLGNSDYYSKMLLLSFFEEPFKSEISEHLLTHVLGPSDFSVEHFKDDVGNLIDTFGYYIVRDAVRKLKLSKEVVIDLIPYLKDIKWLDGDHYKSIVTPEFLQEHIEDFKEEACKSIFKEYVFPREFYMGVLDKLDSETIEFNKKLPEDLKNEILTLLRLTGK